MSRSHSGQGNPFPVILSSTAIVSISSFALYKMMHFHRHRNKNEKSSKFMLINQIVFYSSCIVFGITYPLTDFLEYLSVSWRIVFAVETLTHGLLHFYALINIFYERLINVFQDTDLALTDKTKKVFNTSYIILILLGIISWIVIQIERDETDSIWTISIFIPYLFIMICITQFLSFMFIIKLYKINRLSDESKVSNITPIMRKFTILSVVAMSGTLFYIIFIGIYHSMDHNISQWIVNVMKQIDLFTNLICLTLSYKLFDKYYYICCYCCDAGCRNCCTPSNDIPLMENTSKTTSTALSTSKKAIQITHPSVDAERFLRDNELGNVIEMFKQFDVAIEELVEFATADLRTFAEEHGVNVIQQNKLIKSIEELKQRSISVTETAEDNYNTSIDNTSNEEPKTMIEVSIASV